MRVILGAGEQRWDGWIPTQQAQLDVLNPASFAAYFGDARADAFLCEHVWEHLTVNEGERAARLVFEYLKPGGVLRVAVPDGHQCGCGRLGCIEQYASGSALVRFARAGARQEPDRATALLDLAGGEAEAITGPMVTWVRG